MEILSWLNKNFLTKFLFLHKKALLEIIFLCRFFEVKNQNELIAIKTYIKDFIDAAKFLISGKMQKKWNEKVTNLHFLKQMLLFHFFYTLYSWVCEKMCSIFRIILLLYSLKAFYFYQDYF